MTDKYMIVTARGLVDGEMLSIINQRDKALIEADHLVNIAEDNGVDATPYRQYRQQLRDIPQTYQNADDVVWPTKPSLPSA